METTKTKKAVLAVLVVFALCGPVWAEPVSMTYVFIPDQSTVVQTGGFAGIYETHTIAGTFWLQVDFDANTASFDQVDANLSESIYLPTQSLGELFEMHDLNSTEVNETAIKFEDDNPPLGGIEIDITVTFVDDSLHLTGGRVEPWIDGFGYGLDAVAVRQPVIYYVDIDATGANNGSSWADAYNSLPEALGDANSSGVPVEIRVAQGTYKPNDGIVGVPELDERALSFQLINCVVVKGGYAGFGEPDPNARDIDAYETILSGDLNGDDVDVAEPCDLAFEPTRGENSYHVVSTVGTDSNAVLDGFTITGGYANGDCISTYSGGGIYNENVPSGDWDCTSDGPTIINCRITGNYAGGEGGGMYNRYSCRPEIINCVFIENTALWGGGGMKNDTSHPTIADCIFKRNFAGESYHSNGGGIDNEESNPSVTNSTFIENTADYGGGIYNRYDQGPVLLNCTFSGNRADAGGGMYSDESSPTLTNCMFSGNSAYGDGGGIGCQDSNVMATNCTIAKNSAVFKGGGIFGGPDSELTMSNCIVWDNSAEFGRQIYLFGGLVDATYSDVQGGYPGEGNIDSDPLFAGPNSDDYHIVGGSPCIDTGDPNYIAEPNETDLDGNPRIVNGVVDMGAYEFQGLLYVDDDAPNDPGPGDPNVSDPLEDGSEAHPFDEIQEAIDVALDGHTVLVQTGLYTGPDVWISGEIDFLGKNITVTSTDPTDWNIVNNTVIAGLVEFSGTEDANCTLTGFTIRDIAYGRIWGNHTHATISYCNISGNGPCGAIVIQDCDGTISNCLITDNTTIYLCGIFPVIRGCHGVLKNCTIASNASGIEILDGGTATIENCIIYHNSEQWTAPISVGSGGTLSISYCNLQGGLAGIGGEGDVNWGAGNIDTDPCFARLVEYLGDDYHLKSEGWRWSEQIVHGSHWLYDYVTSRCIDAGNPGSPLRDEVMTVLPDDPNNDWGINLRINMGAYGGTAEASMPPHGWALLADLNNDGIVDWLDAGLWVQHWLAADSELPADLDRNGSINGFDWALFGQDWSSETLWR